MPSFSTIPQSMTKRTAWHTNTHTHTSTHPPHRLYYFRNIDVSTLICQWVILSNPKQLTCVDSFVRSRTTHFISMMVTDPTFLLRWFNIYAWHKMLLFFVCLFVCLFLFFFFLFCFVLNQPCKKYPPTVHNSEIHILLSKLYLFMWHLVCGNPMKYDRDRRPWTRKTRSSNVTLMKTLSRGQ